MWNQVVKISPCIRILGSHKHTDQVEVVKHYPKPNTVHDEGWGLNETHNKINDGYFTKEDIESAELNCDPMRMHSELKVLASYVDHYDQQDKIENLIRLQKYSKGETEHQKHPESILLINRNI